jgi:hypothetical protein
MRPRFAPLEEQQDNDRIKHARPKNPTSNCVKKKAKLVIAFKDAHVPLKRGAAAQPD